MSVPTDHHFLPKFFLKRWIDPQTNQVWEYRRPREKVIVLKKAASATGKQKNLYTVEGLAVPELQEQVELKLMHPLDTLGAEAIEEMLRTGDRPKDKKHRDGWARFVMSVMHRSPERMRYFAARIEQERDQLSQEMTEEYARLRRPEDPETLREFLDQSALATSSARAILLRSMVDSPRIGEAIVQMKWRLLKLPQTRFGLLTGDDPVITSNGLGHKRSFILLPVSPDTIFAAANSATVIDAFAAQDPRALERGLNDAICRQADSLVIGSSNQQKRFVENRLGQNVDERKNGLLERLTWNAPVQ
jgi:hypothetical protein